MNTILHQPLDKSARILIVGAGPTGLTAAIELARRGYRPKVIDAKFAPSTLSRAVGINAHSLDLLQKSGVTPLLLQKGLKMQHAVIHQDGKPVLTLRFDLLPPPYNFLLALPQGETEKIMIDRLAKWDVDVEFGTKLNHLVVGQNGKAMAVLERFGEPANYQADLVIGADGIHSIVRQALGIPFPGFDYKNLWSIADVEVDSFPFNKDALNLFLQNGQAGFIVRIGEERYRAITTTDKALPAFPKLQDRVTEIFANDAFRISVRQASTYQMGQVVLAGDAAHVHSPAGALGMNTGIADAYHLVRLLRNGRLHEYTALRYPAARKVIKLSERMIRMTKFRKPFMVRLRLAVFSLLNNFPMFQMPILRRISGLVE